MIAALAVTGLPFEAASHSYENIGKKKLQITAGSNLMAFRKEIKQAEENERKEILVAQRCFDPYDRYTTSEDDPNLKIEKNIDEYVLNKMYGCQVIVTNCSIMGQEFQVLVEVPEGSLPVKTLDYTKSHSMVLDPFTTKSIEFFFYFPHTGKFLMQPSNVSINGIVVAKAAPTYFQVLTEPKKVKLETMTQILQSGSQDDILNFVRTKNLFNTKTFQARSIYWLLKDKKFFVKLIKILRERKVFNEVIWSYAILHQDHEALVELFNHPSVKSKFKKYFKRVETSLLSINQREVHEFHPLVNPRAHLMK